MKIIPLSEIRNTAAVSKLVMENSPVFVTKQGGEHIVMLSHEMYENVKRENTELKEYVKVLEADLEIMKYRLHVPELAEKKLFPPSTC